tara:strand:- start:37 stop:360 length:324 start_codon:yes stop_codon:yes gene_type:complete
MEEPESYEEHMTDAEKLELERKLLSCAYENSFQVLTDKISFNELLDAKDKHGMSSLLAFDPILGIRKHELEGMIEYYIELDQPHYYLRCARLKKILNEKYPETLIVK